MTIVSIADPRVRAISAGESREFLIDIIQEHPTLAVDQSRHNVQKVSSSISLLRISVAKKLVAAQAKLPPGIKFLIKECHRPIEVQSAFWQGHLRYLRERHPERTATQLEEECAQYVAPVDVAPHATGGAVDLTLVQTDGNILDMGTEFNAEPAATHYQTYTFSENITAEARRNRQLLISTMLDAGFVNYPTEWWHWSFGDKYWAFVSGAAQSIFGPV